MGKLPLRKIPAPPELICARRERQAAPAPTAVRRTSSLQKSFTVSLHILTHIPDPALIQVPVHTPDLDHILALVLIRDLDLILGLGHTPVPRRIRVRLPLPVPCISRVQGCIRTNMDPGEGVSNGMITPLPDIGETPAAVSTKGPAGRACRNILKQQVL